MLRRAMRLAFPGARRADMAERPFSYRSLRHWGGFFVSGGSAFVVDAGINSGLIHLVGLSPFVSRLISIGCAMVVAWLMHRNVTFAVAAPPRLSEFARFAVVAGSVNLLNYLVYGGILVVWPATWPFAALVVATAIAMGASYLGFRFGVFRREES